MELLMNFQEKTDARLAKVMQIKEKVGLADQQATIVLALDYSLPAIDFYRSGQMQRLVERMLPLGLAFDDQQQQLDCYIHSGGVHRIKRPVERVSAVNYVADFILGKYAMGGICYEPAITRIFGDHTKRRGGLFTKTVYEIMDRPVCVLFVTTGPNADRILTEQALMEASRAGIFFQFIGLTQERLHFLEKIKISSADFLSAPSFDVIDNDGLYTILLAEFAAWVRSARNKNLIQ